MPRTARTISASGYYHIIARGIGKQILFEEDADYLFFLRLMKNYSSSGEFSVAAFCLMENHVHILAKIADGMMDKVMHNLLATYATYYNKKYDRLSVGKGRNKAVPRGNGVISYRADEAQRS